MDLGGARCSPASTASPQGTHPAPSRRAVCRGWSPRWSPPRTASGTLGEALALAVRDARSDARRTRAARSDLEAAVRASDAAAAEENPPPPSRCGARSSAGCARGGRGGRFGRAERARDARGAAHGEAETGVRGESESALIFRRRQAIGNAPGEDPNPAGWPTRSSRTSRRPPRRRKLWAWTTCSRASGADGDALEAMVREALRGSERRRGARDGGERGREETSVPRRRSVDSHVDDDDEDGDAAASREAEIDPTRWATRIDSTVAQTTSTTVGQTTDAPRASSSSNDASRKKGTIRRRRGGEPSAAGARPARAEKKARATARRDSAVGPPPRAPASRRRRAADARWSSRRS